MSQLPTETELLRRINLLPREVTPVSDEWLNISSRISKISRDDVKVPYRSRAWPFAVAATVLLMAGIGLISGQLPHPSWSIPAPPGSASPDLAQPRLAQFYPGAETSAASEAEYQGAFREFMTLEKSHGAPLQHSLADFGAGWSALREAEVELKVALSQEPDSIFLNAHMQAVRARQLELLQQISAADMAVWRNTI